jgi:uncharacterized iron-regulated membrane protein
MSYHLKSQRILWLNIHLYLGLLLGLVLSIVGLTGSILVFYEELQEVLNHQQIVMSTKHQELSKPKPLDEMIAAAELIKPAGSRFFKIYYPRKEEIAYKLLYVVNQHQSNQDGDSYYIFVNPYTSEVSGIQLWHPAEGHWRRPLMSLIMQLHYCLLVDSFGVKLVGYISLLALISVISGLYLWWPITGKFRKALHFRKKASFKRFNYDLHTIAGVYSSLVLILMLTSGIYFNLPDEMKTLLKPMIKFERPNAWEGMESEKLRSVSSSKFENKQLTPGQIETIVEANYPEGNRWMMSAPTTADGVYYIWKRKLTSLSKFIGYREFAVDQYSGNILKIYNANSGAFWDILLDWQWPIHSGQAFGWVGRGLVFLSGLVFPILFFTGVIRWLQKKKVL